MEQANASQQSDREKKRVQKYVNGLSDLRFKGGLPELKYLSQFFSVQIVVFEHGGRQQTIGTY
jgi:hypothetical protein